MAGELTFRFEGLIRARDDSWEDFVGPLDAILLLLSRDKIEIQDLSISQLVEQYLAMLAEWESMDIEIATEFTVMASHLVYLKTRMLLAVGDGRDEEVDSLLLALQDRQRDDAYRRIKWAADLLAGQVSGFDYISKPPTPLDPRPYDYQHDAEHLRVAYLSLLDRMETANAPVIEAFAGIVGRERHPVGDSMETVLARTVRDGCVAFEALLADCSSRSQVISTFLALLELCKDGRIRPADEDEGLVFYAAEPRPDKPTLTTTQDSFTI